MRGSHLGCIPGLCSNALAFANASANAAFALVLAFNSSAMAAFALAFAFDSSAFALAFDSNAIDWNQMRNKCESNATVLLMLPNLMFILLIGFLWNKHQEDQYKNV